MYFTLEYKFCRVPGGLRNLENKGRSGNVWQPWKVSGFVGKVRELREQRLAEVSVIIREKCKWEFYSDVR